MRTKRVVAGTVLLLVCTVACGGTFSPPGKTTATGQPLGMARPDEPIDTTPPGKAAPPEAEAEDVSKAKPGEDPVAEAKPKEEPKGEAKPAMTPEEARRLYEMRYGEQVKQVDATAGKEDDVALAAQHIADVEKFADYKALVKIMLEEAYELAMRHKSGCATATKAVDLLLEKFPGDRATYLDRAVKACEVQYRLGDRKGAGEKLIALCLEIAAAAAGRQDFDKAAAAAGKAYGIATLAASPRAGEVGARRRYYEARKELKARPDDAQLRGSAIALCVAELDDPAEAAKLLDDVADEKLRTYVPLAAKATDDVPEAACLELGAWYSELARTASQRGKATCLKRATGYLERYLAIHKAEDTPRMKAKLLLDKAAEQLASLPAAAKPKPAAEPEGQWVDVLKLADPARNAVYGNWTRSGFALAGNGRFEGAEGNPRLMLPVPPAPNYELEVRFEAAGPKPMAGVILPVGRSGVAVVFFGTLTLRGVKDDTGRFRSLEVRQKLLTKTPYVVRATVWIEGEKADLAVVVNGKEAFRWEGPTESLSIPKPYDLPKPGHVGVSCYAPTTFSVVKFRELAARPAAPPGDVAKAPPKARTTTKMPPVSISVKQPWPFSMKVKTGQTLHITATGKWRILPRGKQHGPNDAKFYLRGRLGNGAPFKVGSKYTLEVKEDATLYLGIREGGIYGNNSGSVKVVITKTE